MSPRPKLLRRIAGSSLGLLASLASCTAMQRQRAAEIALFPVNVGPNVLSNTLVLLTLPAWAPFSDTAGNVWPVMWLSSPIAGPILGVADAWHGYPLWDPHAVDERRRFTAAAPPSAGESGDLPSAGRSARDASALVPARR